MENQKKPQYSRSRKAAAMNVKAKLVENKFDKGLVKREFAPLALGRVRRSQRPVISSIGNNGDVVIAHREYITDLSGSVGFAAISFPVNPGLPGTFPWLSSVASRFESYAFDKLCFKFETEKSASTNGSVLGAIDYDASDSAPANKTQVMSYRSATRSQTWEDFDMSSLSEDLHKRKSYFTRFGSLTANEDIKLYDTGNFFFCTQGQADTTLVGELYVEYIIRLMTPQIGNPGLGTSLYGAYSGTTNGLPFETIGGSTNLPATVASTGTTASQTTFTFTQPFTGIGFMMVAGTGLSNSAVGTSTASVTTLSILTNSAGTEFLQSLSIEAQIGQTLALVVDNTTISSSNIFFAQGYPF